MLDEVDATSGHSAQQRVQARCQLAQVKRLEQVVIGARLQAVHAVGHCIPRSQNQYRQIKALLAQLLQQLEPVFIR